MDLVALACAGQRPGLSDLACSGMTGMDPQVRRNVFGVGDHDRPTFDRPGVRADRASWSLPPRPLAVLPKSRQSSRHNTRALTSRSSTLRRLSAENASAGIEGPEPVHGKLLFT